MPGELTPASPGRTWRWGRYQPRCCVCHFYLHWSQPQLDWDFARVIVLTTAPEEWLLNYYMIWMIATIPSTIVRGSRGIHPSHSSPRPGWRLSPRGFGGLPIVEEHPPIVGLAQSYQSWRSLRSVLCYQSWIPNRTWMPIPWSPRYGRSTVQGTSESGFPIYESMRIWLNP